MSELGSGIHIYVDKIEGEQHTCKASPFGADGSAVFDTRTGVLKAQGRPPAVLRAVLAVLHFETIFKEFSGKETRTVEDMFKELSRTSDEAGAAGVAGALVQRIKEVDGAPIDQACEVKLFDDSELLKMYARH